MNERKRAAEKLTPLYNIVTYKEPAEKLNDGNLEEIETLTVYRDSNIVKEQAAAETIKAFSVSEEYLTVYTTVPEE